MPRLLSILFICELFMKQQKVHAYDEASKLPVMDKDIDHQVTLKEANFQSLLSF